MRYLLVQPEYYSKYPPIGLLKISTLLKSQKNTVQFIKGMKVPKKEPDQIFVTSLFTYAWKIVHKTVKFYKESFPDAKLTLGGLYASLLPDHAKKSGADEIFTGLYKEADEMLPDYNLLKGWDANIIFTSRGCIRKCGFCAVPKLEPEFLPKKSILEMIDKRLPRIIIWDNNFLANPYALEILDELKELGKKVDFNHGLDMHLITPENASKLKKLKMIFLRFAYDLSEYHDDVKHAIDILTNAGFRSRDIIFYTLYNYNDSPEDFFKRHKDLMEWGASSYPMRYVPLDALNKNKFISNNWTKEELEMIADARRVIGIKGTFVPYKGFQKKILEAKNFNEAFKLREIKKGVKT